jgi:hypothetical protein
MFSPMGIKQRMTVSVLLTEVSFPVWCIGYIPLCGSEHSTVWIGTFHCMDRNIPLYGSEHSTVCIGTFHCMDRNIPLYGSEHSTGRHSFPLTSCRTIRGIHKSKHDSYPPRSLPSLNIISQFGSPMQNSI